MIYEAERAWEPGLTQISTFHSEKSDDWIALKKVLVPNIERYNITLEQLKSVFDGKLCSLPAGDRRNHLLELDEGHSRDPECIAGNKISFIGMNTICFRLVGYKNYLRPLGTTEYIYLNLNTEGTNQNWSQELTIDLGSESRSTPLQGAKRNETYAHYYDRFAGAVRIQMDIGIKALYRKLPYVKGDLQCSSDTNQEECEKKCLRGWIRANCHCSPTTFNLTAGISDFRNCTLDDYSICLKTFAKNATSLCVNKCVPLCEQWHYEYNLNAYSSSWYSNVQISPRIFDYVIIEQVFSWPSFEEFIGALGGALGIWLGLDFVIIIEFIVTLVTKLSKRILLRNAHKSEEAEHRKSVNIEHSEENDENRISSSNETGNHVIEHNNKNEENESEIGETSIRRISESEKQRTSRKKRESNALKEKHVQQRRKRSSNIRVGSVILDDKIKNVDAHDGGIRNHIVNITDDADAVQDEFTARANYSTARSWFSQKMPLLFLNGDASANKAAMLLRLVKKLFWAVIYLLGSIFTAFWCVELIKLFLDDEAVHYPTLIINRTISLPPPSHCIFYENSLIERKHGKISNDLMTYFNQSNRTSFTQISEGNVWPEPLVSVGLLYFTILAASETNYTDVTFTSEYERQLNLLVGNDILLRNDLNKSFNDILLPKLLEWNVTANELRQKLGAELARMAELKITFTNVNGTTDIVKEASFYTAAITNKFFCYGLSYSANFIDPDNALEFSINRARYQQLLPSGMGGYIFFSDYSLEPESAQFDIDDFNVAVYDADYYQFGYGSVTRILISSEGLYTSRPTTKGVKYCSSSVTKTYCRARCRIELIEKLCNCSPTYWATMIQLTSGLEECTFDRYMGCLNFSASDDLDCKDSCLPSCTARYFRSDLTLNGLSEEYYDTAVIRFSVKDGTYVSIEEKPIFTFNKLLIKLGGTLGILLGFNIFSFYRTLVAAAMLCSAFILKRTRFAQSHILLKTLDKIRKSGIAQLIAELNQQLRIMKICSMKKNIKVNEFGKNILLSIGYMVGLYATVRLGNDLYYSFKSGEPKCLVDLMVNSTIKLPSSTICMPLEAFEFQNETEVSHFEENAGLTRNLYFNSFHNKEEFFSELWPMWLLQWTYEYLIIYDTVERHGNQKFISTLLPDNDSYASHESRAIISNYSFTSLIELDELIDHLNITIPELKQNLGQKVRDIYNTAAVFVKNGTWNETVLNITDTTFIGGDRVCYKLPLDTVTFSSKSDYLFIFLDRGSLLNQQNSNNEKPIYIDFSGRDVSKEQPTYSSIIGSTHSFWFGDSSSAKLDISGLYEAKPMSSGVRHCSESKSMDTCQDECQQKKIERVCKCVPTAWLSFSSNTNLPQCHLIDYKRCASLLVSNDADVCESSCVPRCTRISFKDMPSENREHVEHDVAYIFIRLNSFEYLSFKEVSKYTLTDFINEFGAILGLWIGLDTLVFVDLFYWLVCKYCHLFRQFL